MAIFLLIVLAVKTILQVSSGNKAVSNSSIVARYFGLERKHAELQSIKDMAKAKSSKLRLLAEVEEAELLEKLHLELINLEAEVKLLAISEHGSSVFVQTRKSKTEIALRLHVVGSHL